ncbi:uncharacterized protein [Anoplolepis gracilipes]|uniref:uncharacterized protein n=1 Tax=Anoplolepis gracilipes TaxID=354296 RepID=UPI003BA2874C
MLCTSILQADHQLLASGRLILTMTSKRWKDDVVYAMTPLKLVTWPIGVWPLQVYNICSLLRCALCICCISLIVILTSMEIYLACTDVEQNIECLMIICCGIIAFLKTTWFRIYAKNLIINFDSAINDYMTIDNIKERDIMRKHAFIGRILCCFMLGCSVFGCLIYATFPFLNYDQSNWINVTNENMILEYTVPSKCALEYFNFPRSMYNILWFIETVALIVLCTANIGNDALFLCITLHICGQVNILRIRFLNFDITSPRIYDRFNALIQRHHYLIKLTRQLAELVSFILLIKLFIISVLLCIMGFQLILALKLKDIILLGKSFLGLSGFLFQLTLYSFIGNYLKSEMEEIGLSIYQSAWYSFPRKITRDVLFILMQTKFPVALQAGNFIIINLATYRGNHLLLASVTVIISTMASERWNDDIAYAMTPYKLIAWPIGVWPLQIYNIYSLLRCALGTFCASLLVILPAMDLYMGCTDVEQNIDCLMLICCGILGILKTMCFRIYANSLINNYDSALNDYLTNENTKERNIMRKHAFIGRILCLSMLGISYFSCLIYGTIPFLNYNQGNWINITDGNIILEYTMPSRCALEFFNFPISMHKISCLIELVVIMLATTANLGNDALFLNITLHVCGQVNILRVHFLNFDVTSPQICDRFNVLIKRHRYLIILAKELADLISFILLIELFIISILLCIMGFQLILALKVHNTIMAGKSLMILSAFLSQLTLYSFIGNYLKSEMEEIGLSIYQSAWYKFPRKLTKNVIFILMQTRSPVALQAGNFILVNLSTYVSILKTSFSYLSVLRIMLEV